MKSLGSCTICRKSASKYCCPKCSTSTCSLICSREHKKKKSCDGKRDPVKFVSLKAFDDLTMLSDYRLLECAGRVVEACARDPMKRYTRYKEELPKHLKYLKSATFQRGCRLKYLPQHFIRHSQNSTYLNWMTRTLKWKVEWNFDQAGVQKISDSLSESALLGAALCSLIEDPELIYYKSAGIRNMKILMIAEEQKGKRKRYYECDPSLTLRGNLLGLTIIEYPIMHVVLQNHIQAYKVIPREDEEKEDLGIQGIIDSEPSASEASEDSDTSSLSDESEDEDESTSPKKGSDEQRKVPELQRELKGEPLKSIRSKAKKLDSKAQQREKEDSLTRSQQNNTVRESLASGSHQQRGEEDYGAKPGQKRKADDFVPGSQQKKKGVESLGATPHKEDQLLLESDIKKEPEDHPTVEVASVHIKVENMDCEPEDCLSNSQPILKNCELPLIKPKIEKGDQISVNNEHCVSQKILGWSTDEENISRNVTQSMPDFETNNDSSEDESGISTCEDPERSVTIVSPPPENSLVCYDVSDSE